ncbi:AAA family ATPase [Kangiella sp.]|uniref:AAA family ATPase n=1 Tax=Kangiella sp. TaxID=1920245 RepID=UPI003A935780
MKIKLKNCNNIDEAEISIDQNKLNIRFGINGTGKTTIAKAILYSVEDKGELKKLKPFNSENKASSVEGLEEIKKVSVFNDEFINSVLFKEEELVDGSFDIFIKDKKYDEKIGMLHEELKGVAKIFEDEKYEKVIEDLNEISNCFKTTKSGISKNCSGYKAVKDANKVKNIPKALEVYREFIEGENNNHWISWQIAGGEFLKNKCPYCTNEITDEKEFIKKVEEEYEPKVIEHLNKVAKAIESLGGYFSEDTRNNLTRIIDKNDKLLEEDEAYILSVKSNIDIFKEKLERLKKLSFYSVSDAKKIKDALDGMQIDYKSLNHLQSGMTKEIIYSIESELESLRKQSDKLDGMLTDQKNRLKVAIEKNENEINDFMRMAGYNYRVRIKQMGEEYKLVLEHLEANGVIVNGASHLSFGEKNAFSLVLFMYKSISEGCDLFILDDPISSFDNTKKYAILERLFKKSGTLQGKTVLLLTHDFEPVIDLIKTLKGKFQPIPNAKFLRNKKGKLVESEISPNDIKTFYQICQENISNTNEDILKCIHLRRYFEILDDKGLEYNLLSSLVHKKNKPTIKSLEKEDNMTEVQINNAINKIENSMEDFDGFDYFEILKKIKDSKYVIEMYKKTLSNFEKLQLFRLLEVQQVDPVLMKFVNETYHIENDFVCQLNPLEYELIPDSIVDYLDSYIEAEV